jgi:hypothetical protein
MNTSQFWNRILIVLFLLALIGPGAFPSSAAHIAAGAGMASADSLPGSGVESARSRIVVDASGNAYVIGTSDAVWGTNPVRPFQGGSDAFVARLSPSGALQWLTFLGGES